MPDSTFIAQYNDLKWSCIECNAPVNGEGVFATGEPVSESYHPEAGEWIKNIWMECIWCGWNQYS